MKKRYGTTDFLKKYSGTMIERARQYGDTKTENLFKEILEVLKKHNLS